MKKIPVVLLMAFWPAASFAGPQVGTLTNVEGSVQVYSHPSKDGVDGPPPHAKFEGTYYSVSEGTVGIRLEKGNILRTLPGAKARIIFDNGDQYCVGPATAFKVNWDRDTADARPEVELRYGKSRFVIEKGGPRSKFRVRTKTAVMGVRGTDFFVAVNDAAGTTETATLRGSVEVKQASAAQATTAAAEPKAAVVSAGQTASASASPVIEVHKTTQDELKAVSRNSEVKPTPPQAAAPEVAQKVQALEAAAATATLKDIRTSNPELADKLGNGTTEAAVLNQAVVAELEKRAPADEHAGPISDQALEKGEQKTVAENKDDSDTKDLPSSPVWIGFRMGGGGAKLNLSGNPSANAGFFGVPCGGASQPPCNMPVYSGGSVGGGQPGLQAEFNLASRVSLLAEFLMDIQDGGYGQWGPPNNCGTGPCFSNYDKIEIHSTRLNAIFKWNHLLFGSRRFGFFLGAGPGFNIIRNAMFPDNMQQDITNSFTNPSLVMNLGVGLQERIGNHLKFVLDFRSTHGLTNIAKPNMLFSGGTEVRVSESAMGMNLTYGL